MKAVSTTRSAASGFSACKTWLRISVLVPQPLSCHVPMLCLLQPVLAQPSDSAVVMQPGMELRQATLRVLDAPMCHSSRKQQLKGRALALQSRRCIVSLTQGLPYYHLPACSPTNRAGKRHCTEVRSLSWLAEPHSPVLTRPRDSSRLCGSEAGRCQTSRSSFSMRNAT